MTRRDDDFNALLAWCAAHGELAAIQAADVDLREPVRLEPTTVDDLEVRCEGGRLVVTFDV